MYLQILKLLLSFIIIPTRTVISQEAPITFGSTNNLGILPLIAQNEQLFALNGLSVSYKKFQTGKMIMDALVSGDIDIGTIVESNVGFIGYSGAPIKIIAELGTKLDDTLLFKKEAKISSPKDLIGKKIGYTPATTSHIFLTRFLTKNKIKWSDITPVILQPSAMESALRSGVVDAVSTWAPWTINIKGSLLNKVG